MPIYEYQCEDCQFVFEEWQSGFEEKEFPCPHCGGKSKRLISHSSFHLKGSGWYADGYGAPKSGSKPGEAQRPSCGGDGDSSTTVDSTPAQTNAASDSSSAGSAS
ncbi:zinc ribbon domain-containing protein [Pseudodesulfovibrio sp. JC047]|uniref:FmdB family zinc ribbon protein n=1 Tax=Pseudodesulfovibrio sp. JC047 TaxID=2683199 RepID=UPI0013D7E04E|nr:zinc ribbon domain-containing protein [Pseudodesulfovibrio sp. JC047]NDV18546.1 zinc ribbon domain-containing protein [Pseudodesulfovibrio sp. JC047]